jgi:uncharacterized protein (TIRG00374 family)
MIAMLRRGVLFVMRRPALRVALQCTMSALLLAALFYIAQRGALLDTFRLIALPQILLAMSITATGYVLNTRRWQLLLENVGVREPLAWLAQLYFIGLFFSLFLPTGTGGDAVRMYQVARRSGRPTEAVVATLQERLFGLGASLLIGLVAAFYFLPRLPVQFQLWALLVQTLGILAVGVLIYPTPFFAAAERWAARRSEHPLSRRLAEHRLVKPLLQLVDPVRELPKLKPRRILGALVLALAALLLGITMYYLLAQGLQLQVGFIELCLVVPLVWIVRMAPVSLNGIGVGEGAFVSLMSLFGIPVAQSLTLALAVLALQTGLALVGGLVLLIRIALGQWTPTRVPGPDAAR